MNSEECLKIADAAVFSYAKRHLKDVEATILRGSWAGKKYHEIADTYGYNHNYLRQDAGPRLWKLLSDAFGEKVSKTNFRNAIERRSNVGGILQRFQTSIERRSQLQRTLNSARFMQGRLSIPTEQTKDESCINVHNNTGLANEAPISKKVCHTKAKVLPFAHLRGKLTNFSRLNTDIDVSVNKYRDWGDAVDVSIFYGRTEEIIQLEKWIVSDRCRLVGLVGMAGVGKTMLSVKLAHQIEPEFEYIIWRSLSLCPTLDNLLEQLIQFFSGDRETILPATTEGKMSRLMIYLRQHRCLLILDNFESILQSGASKAGYYQTGYESYGELLRRIGESSHQSCLVLTSQEKPQEVALMEGEASPIRSSQVNGLDEFAAKEILKAKGIFGSDKEYKQLIQQYTTNPTLLKLISRIIHNLFDGNITQYMNHCPVLFGDIYHYLEIQFNRLSKIEKTIMYCLAINFEPILLTEFQKKMALVVTQRDFMESLNSLNRRCLINISGQRIFLDSLLINYVIEKENYHKTKDSVEALVTS